MAQERLAPDSLAIQTNLSGTVSDIQDDPDSPDANWLTAVDNKADTVLRVHFPAPSGALESGADLQEFRVRARPANIGGSSVPYALILINRVNGTQVATLASGNMGGSSETIISGTWDITDLPSQDGADAALRLEFTGQGGSPAARNTGEVGAVEWNAELAAATNDFDFTLSGSTLGFTGQVLIDGTVSMTLSPVTQTFVGEVLVQGTFDFTLSPVTQSFTSAIPPVDGTFDFTFSPLTQTFTGEVLIGGTFAQTLAPLTQSFVGEVAIESVLGFTAPSITQAFSGSVLIVATLATTLSGPTMSFSSAVGPVDGTFAQTLSPVTEDFAGSVAVEGTMQSLLAGATIDFSGQVLVAGDMSMTMPKQSQDFAGQVLVNGDFNLTLGAMRISLEESEPIPLDRTQTELRQKLSMDI